MTCPLINKNRPGKNFHRSSKELMNLDRLGALYPNRLSFSRTLIRRMSREAWNIQKIHFNLDKKGVGTAIYKIDTKQSPLWFVVFTQNLSPEDRTDRVIAEKWDATFTLTCEKPDSAVLDRLQSNVPLQEMGRYTPQELVLSRVNKSVRLFDYVSDKLAKGYQPDPAELMNVGYLVRTTAVYGNGKFGLSDLENIKRQKLFELPFQPEMLCVYLARCFSFDWVEHVAYNKNPLSFKPLDDRLKRALGVGNATGLGMAPFLINHPKLICRWITARENALAKVRAMQQVSGENKTRLIKLINEAHSHVLEWPTTDEGQKVKIEQLRKELLKTIEKINSLNDDYFFDQLISWATCNIDLEGQELLNSLVIEINPDIVDHLELETASNEQMFIEPSMSLDTLLKIIKTRYSWALELPLEGEAAKARFWYRSEEKEEPRLGWRFKEPGAEKELRLGIAQNVRALHNQLRRAPPPLKITTVAEFLLQQPIWREIIQRIQSLRNCQYAEISNNLLEENCHPIKLLRCKLAMFGATKFDPKSDLWIRIALFQGAPLFTELNNSFGEWNSLYSFDKD
jgi:hypothetical protein